MGTDKALLDVDGRPMAVRAAAALGAAGAEAVTAVGGDGSALAAAGLHWVPDRWPGEGPLGGIVTGLRDAGSAPTVVVLACDLLAPDAAAIAAIAAHRTSSGADVAVPIVEGREQWLHAAWDRRISRLLGDVFASGERSVVGACLGLAVAHVEGLGRAAAADADTPEDLPGVATGPDLPTIADVDIPVIDIDTLAAQLDAGAPVFDVRQPDEYEEAHAPGVRLVPLDQVPERVDEFPADERVYVICKSGGRSAKAVEFLRNQGVDAVNVAGGTSAWIESGKPVETGA